MIEKKWKNKIKSNNALLARAIQIYFKLCERQNLFLIADNNKLFIKFECYVLFKNKIY